MSDNQNPQKQKPTWDDQAFFISKFLVIQIFGLLFVLAAVGVATTFGSLLFMLGGMLGKFTGLPAGILIFLALNRERNQLVSGAYKMFLLNDAVKLGLETEESARKLAGLPPKKDDKQS